MQQDFSLTVTEAQKAQDLQQLEKCNELSARFGLILTGQQMENLAAQRWEALAATGRVEFGAGILPKLIEAFCDSPFLSPANYEAALAELQSSFYYFKNECHDLISDDELIAFMQHVFNGRAQGSLEYLSGTSLDELCRNTRYGYAYNDPDEELPFEED